MTLALLPGADARLLRDLTKPPRAGRFNCAFCGARCWGRVCHAHRDLLEMEAEPTAPSRENTVSSDNEGVRLMARLPSDDVLDALVDVFDDRYIAAPLLGPGWRYDKHTGQPMYSSEWLSDGSDAVEGHFRPDELEVRRRQRELNATDRTRSIGRGRAR